MKDGKVEAKVHSQIHLSQYMSYNTVAKGDAITLYKLLINQKNPTKSSSRQLAPSDVLLDTGASVSLMPFNKAKDLGVEVTPRTDILVHGVDGNPLILRGLQMCYA